MNFFRSLYLNFRQHRSSFQEIRSITLCGVLLMCAVLLPEPTSAQLMAPEEVLGFQVGSDYQVAGWKTVSDYMRHVAANSDRVLVEELGRTTEGNDLLMMLISAPENLENLARHQQIPAGVSDSYQT